MLTRLRFDAAVRGGNIKVSPVTAKSRIAIRQIPTTDEAGL
jgi:tripartite-type tricarboxylate transporter receptor subunit TctC